MKEHYNRDFISVIVSTYARQEYLQACLLSIIQNAGFPVELIIADGGSGLEFCNTAWRLVRQIRHPLVIPKCFFPMVRIPFAETMNACYHIARSEYVILANDDIEVLTTDWAERMIHHAEQNPNAGVIGTVTQNSYQKQNVGPAHDCDKHIGEVKEIDQVAGVFCLINRRIWDELGGYDESLGSAGGDADYSIRVQAAGYKALFAQDVKVLHKQCHGRADKDAVRAKYGVDDFKPDNIPHCIEVARRTQ